MSLGMHEAGGGACAAEDGTQGHPIQGIAWPPRPPDVGRVRGRTRRAMIDDGDEMDSLVWTSRKATLPRLDPRQPASIRPGEDRIGDRMQRCSEPDRRRVSS